MTPQLRGDALIAQLRRWYPKAQVLVITGDPAPSLAQLPEDVMALPKPFLPADLAQAVRLALDTQHAREV